MSQFEYKEIYERSLPHFQPPGATLFVTFRLDGSIPQAVLEQWRAERRELEMRTERRAAGARPQPELAEEKLAFRRRWFKKFENVMDGATSGPLWLREARVAAIVDEALQRRDGKAYRLDEFCVMHESCARGLCAVADGAGGAPGGGRDDSQEAAWAGRRREAREGGVCDPMILPSTIPIDDTRVQFWTRRKP